MTQPPIISVIIKTFNEQEGIAATIDSVRQQLAPYRYQIIVADSLSTDRTRTIAKEAGVTVVTLSNPEERCCGVGHQLGYLHSQGKYLLLLDGDMTLLPGFIDQALSFLEQNDNYAGVAGTVEMEQRSSYEFKSRQQRHQKIYPLGDCDYLAGGGLYRKSAIDAIGYLTHRTLHAYEEAELGMRLSQAGYRLRRLDTPFFHHTAYTMPTLTLMKYRWQRGYLFASGELIKSALGTSHLGCAVRAVRNELLFGIYLFWLMISVLIGSIGLILWSLLPLLVFFALKTIKNRSLKDAGFSVLNLSVLAAGLFTGLCLPIKDPTIEPEHWLEKGHQQ